MQHEHANGSTKRRSKVDRFHALPGNVRHLDAPHILSEHSVGDFMSFNEIVETLNRLGHTFTFNPVPPEVFATLFPGASEVAETFK